MAMNAFEDSRISEGTMHAGAQHISNMPGSMKTDPPPARSQQPVVHQILGTTTLSGAGVRNPAGDSLGKIEDIMIDLSSGRIAYALLSFGGLFGIGNKLFILPWSSLTFHASTNEFIVDIQREVLEKGPGFERENRPDMADAAYGADIHRHYGKTPYWEHTLTDFSGGEFTANRCCE